MKGFFDSSYQTPTWFNKKFSRRGFLKSAGGATAIAAMPAIAKTPAIEQAFLSTVKQPKWQTLNAVLNHLLPSSPSGPGAQEIQALFYFYQLITVQPIDEDEKSFIFKGIGWLNDYSNSQLQRPFVDLTHEQKEKILRGISQSVAGENWLTTLLGYLFEAMLAPPAYGGNPQGIGWQWLQHQAGFPLPEQGQRYWEIPGYIQPNSSAKVTVAKQSTTGKGNRKA